jgi:AcrR family transcriptional regulator
MTDLPAPGRARNAVATKNAILQAAKCRFAREGYDGASLREIAADARVDAALISRYFGSKDELFTEVLNLSKDPSDLFEGDMSEFGARVATKLLDDPQDGSEMDILLIMLRSASSPNAAEPLRRAMSSRFHDPFAAWLGGPDAAVRARLAGDIIMGVAISRAISESHDLDEAGLNVLRRRLAAVLQAAVGI